MSEFMAGNMDLKPVKVGEGTLMFETFCHIKNTREQARTDKLRCIYALRDSIGIQTCEKIRRIITPLRNDTSRYLNN